MNTLCDTTGCECGKAVGIVLDLSLRHDGNGVRIIDTVKKSLVEYIRKGLEDEDSFYLYHPDVVEPLYQAGDQTCAVGNYETDGYQFNLAFAAKQTLYVLANEDEDYQKYLCIITDRMTDPKPIHKLLMINEKDDVEAHVILIGIGHLYDLNAIVVDESTNVHLDDPHDVLDVLLEETCERREQA